MNREVVARLHRFLVGALEGSRPTPFDQPITVAEIYQDLAPYRNAREVIGVDLNADYEHALLGLLSGLDDRARLEPEGARDEVRRELQSPSPNVTLYRKFAACDVWIRPLREGGGVSSATTPDRAASEPAPAQEPTAPAPAPASEHVAPPHALPPPGPASPPAPHPGTPAGPPASAPDASGAGVPAGAGTAPDASRATPPGVVRPAPPDGPRTAPPGGPRAAPPGGPRAAPLGGPRAALPGGPRAALPGGPRAALPEIAGPTPPRGPRITPSGGPGVSQGGRAAVAAASCPACRGRLPAARAVHYCPHCGVDQRTRPCGSCGEPVEPGWSYCIACGRPVRPPPAS